MIAAARRRSVQPAVQRARQRPAWFAAPGAGSESQRGRLCDLAAARRFHLGQHRCARYPDGAGLVIRHHRADHRHAGHRHRPVDPGHPPSDRAAEDPDPGRRSPGSQCQFPAAAGGGRGRRHPGHPRLQRHAGPHPALRRRPHAHDRRHLARFAHADHPASAARRTDRRFRTAAEDAGRPVGDGDDDRIDPEFRARGRQPGSRAEIDHPSSAARRCPPISPAPIWRSSCRSAPRPAATASRWPSAAASPI